MNQFFYISYSFRIYIILTSYDPLVYWKWRGREKEERERTRIKGKVNEETLLRLPNDSFFSIDSKLAGRIALNIKILSHINIHRIVSKSR